MSWFPCAYPALSEKTKNKVVTMKFHKGSETAGIKHSNYLLGPYNSYGNPLPADVSSVLPFHVVAESILLHVCGVPPLVYLKQQKNLKFRNESPQIHINFSESVKMLGSPQLHFFSLLHFLVVHLLHAS